MNNNFLLHLYNAIVKDIDLKPGHVYNTEGSMNLDGKLKIVVYSNDHDTHFHVKYLNEIEAKFSFPEVRLIRYVSKKRFTSRQEKNIINTCNSNWECNQFIKTELAKRIT